MSVSCGLILLALLRQNATDGYSTVLGLIRGKRMLWSEVMRTEGGTLGIAFQPGWQHKHSPECPGGVCHSVKGSSHPEPSHRRRLVQPPTYRGPPLISQKEGQKKL